MNRGKYHRSSLHLDLPLRDAKWGEFPSDVSLQIFKLKHMSMSRKLNFRGLEKCVKFRKGLVRKLFRWDCALDVLHFKFVADMYFFKKSVKAIEVQSRQVIRDFTQKFHLRWNRKSSEIFRKSSDFFSASKFRRDHFSKGLWNYPPFKSQSKIESSS